MIEVSRLKDLNATELFLRFRIGAISRRDFAVFPVQGQRGLRRPKGYFGDKMSVGAQMVVVLKAFVERCASLLLGHPFEFSWLDVSQTDVFHRSLLVFCDSENRSSSSCYQIVVRETEIDCNPKLLLRDCSGLNCAGTFVIHENDATRTDNAFRHLERRRDSALSKQPFPLPQ